MKDSISGKSYVELDIFAENYDDAKTKCSAIGGMLPEPRTAQESEFVKQVGTSYWFFLGLTDLLDEGNWSWNTGGSVTWAMWENGEPDGGTSQNCAAQIRGAHVWISGYCDNPNGLDIPIVCEKTRKSFINTQNMKSINGIRFNLLIQFRFVIAICKLCNFSKIYLLKEQSYCPFFPGMPGLAQNWGFLGHFETD